LVGLDSPLIDTMLMLFAVHALCWWQCSLCKKFSLIFSFIAWVDFFIVIAITIWILYARWSLFFCVKFGILYTVIICPLHIGKFLASWECTKTQFLLLWIIHCNYFNIFKTCMHSFNMILLVLRSEISSGMRAKLRTVAASNNREHARNLSSRTLVIMFNRSHVSISRATKSQSLFYCLFAPHICMVLIFTHIPFVVNHTINATPP